MYATGSPALQGSNAAAVINQVNQSILSGGGGMGGNILLSQAMIREGVTDPFQKIALQQLGMFGRPRDLPGGHGDMTSFEAERRELQRETQAMPDLGRRGRRPGSPRTSSRSPGCGYDAVGDHGTAFSGLQSHADRLAAVMRGTGEDPRSSFQAMLDGVQWDLMHGDSGMQVAAGILRQNDDPGADVAAVSMYGVRPGDRYGQAAARANIVR